MGLERWRDLLRRPLTRERAVKAAVVLGICGVLLIYLSSLAGGSDTTAQERAAPAAVETDAAQYAQRLEEELSRVVSAITGEEDPTVLVTLAGGARTVYSLDEKTTERQDETRQRETSHVLVKAADGGQEALAAAQLEPQILGVVIVSARGGDPAVRERLTQAVKTALRLSS